MRRLILILPTILCTPACGPATAPPASSAQDRALDALLGLMRRRLEVMHDVARAKWANKAPIEDPRREATLLEDLASRAASTGLDPGFVRAFFRGQIEAAKVVQRADFGRWESDPEGAGGGVPDLAGELRPRIDALNRDLLAALSGCPTGLRGGRAASLRGRAARLVAGDGIDASAREAAIAPLMAAGE